MIPVNGSMMVSPVKYFKEPELSQFEPFFTSFKAETHMKSVFNDAQEMGKDKTMSADDGEKDKYCLPVFIY